MAKKKAKAKTKRGTKATARNARKKATKLKANAVAKRKALLVKGKVVAKKQGKGATPKKKERSTALAAGYQWANPHLTVKDVEQAIDFYQKALGFQLRFSMPGPDGKIVHAEMEHKDSVIMLGPENPQMGTTAPQGPSPVVLYIYVDNVDDITSRATSLGCRLVAPPEDKFWGDRCSLIVDPQGHTWMLATHVKDVPPDKMQMPSAMQQPTA